MFNKAKKQSAKAAELSNSETGNRYGGAGFRDFISPANGLEKWKPSAGINKIDIIPYNASPKHPFVVTKQVDEGDTFYFLEVFVHKGVGASQSNHVCLRQFGKRCPVCEEGNRLHNLGTPAGDEASKKLWASRRIIYLVHDLINNKYGYWDTGFKSVQQKLNSLAQFEMDGNGAKVDVFDWEEGRTIQFVGTEKTFNGNKYIEPDGFNFAKRQPLSDEVLSHSVDLSTMLNVLNEEALEKVLAGGSVPSDNTPQSQPAPAPVQSGNSVAELAAQAQEVDDAVSAEMAAPAKAEAPAPAAQPAPSAGGNVCPFGHKWGDADNHPECGTCKAWENCIG